MLFKKRPSWISQVAWLKIMRRRDRRKMLRRQLIRFFKSPKLARSYSEYRRAVSVADWRRVKEKVLLLTKLAVQARDPRTIVDMVAALERVGCYRESADLWFSHVAERTVTLPNEWRGEDVSGKTLLINLNAGSHGLGVGYRCAHIVGELLGRARRTIAILEPRQVPTFQRTFPSLEIVTSATDVPNGRADFVALPDYLMMEFDIKPAREARPFHPLLPDPIKTAELRKKYRARSDGRPLIGISWYSSHHGKDLPSLAEWRDFIARSNATFVSLQYGNIAHDLDVLGRDRIIVDESVNQLVNMDDFCSQVAALDGVITIISTLTNVGAALGVPTVVLRDDWFRRNLPVLDDRMPWFPTLRAAGRDRRAWQPVFDDAFRMLDELVRAHPKV